MEGQKQAGFDNASLIDSDSLQVSCRFPNLFMDFNIGVLAKFQE